jgi:hypothetical protein
VFRDDKHPVELLAEQLVECYGAPDPEPERDEWPDEDLDEDPSPGLPDTPAVFALRNLSPEEWRRLVEVLQEMLPRFFSIHDIREALRQQSPPLDLPPKAVGRAAVDVIRMSGCLGRFIEDDTVERLADGCGKPAYRLIRDLVGLIPEGRPIDEHPRALQNILAGRWRDPVQRERLLGMLGHEGASDRPADSLLLAWPVSPSGRVGPPCFGSQSRGLMADDMADDLLKLVAFELAALGVEVVGVCNDELLVMIGMNDELDWLGRSLEEILRRVGGDLLEASAWPGPICICFPFEECDVW